MFNNKSSHLQGYESLQKSNNLQKNLRRPKLQIETEIMTTQISNKLIAEFMGWKEQTNPNERWFGEWFNGSIKETDRLRVLLSFHSSWDWLMPVVEKINSIMDDEDNFKFHFTIQANLCSVVELEKGMMGEQIVCNEHGATLIQMVYETVVEFAEWYKKNNTSNN